MSQTVGGINQLRFSNDVLQEVSEMVSWRRQLHSIPELSFQENETTSFILDKLNSIPGLTVKRPCPTGAIAVLRGTAKPSNDKKAEAAEPRCILLRADIDALPITESNHLPFCSRHAGVMHACGHDGHTAMMLAAAKLLAAQRSRLYGEVRFLFQHAEELPPGGAAELMKAGVMNGVDELYGMHLSSSFPTGTFGVREGALTSATDRFEIRIIGKGGHSAFPETTIDPIVITGQLIGALQTIVSRQIRAVEPAVVSVCQIQAGRAYNIIPDEAQLIGSTRTFSAETRKRLPAIMEREAHGLCEASGATCQFQFTHGYASVINDRALTAECKNLIQRSFGDQAVLDIEPLMPGEDYSALQESGCPGFFVELGARNEALGITAPHHNANYLMDEEAMTYGLQYWVNLVQNRLSLHS